jgi:NAD(P)-dependent dehydrogenase (short-subunit alcohol dehydrogenase family)
MASVAGSAGLAERFAYSAGKGASIAMTYSVARDYIGHNIFPGPGAHDIRRWLSEKELFRPRAGDVRETGEDAADRQNGGTGRGGLACPLLVF